MGLDAPMGSVERQEPGRIGALRGVVGQPVDEFGGGLAGLLVDAQALYRTFRTPSSKAPWIFLPSYPSRGCRVKQLGGTCRAARNASWMAVSGLAKRRSPPTQRMRMPRNFQVTM